jgi:hypothetical protein
MGCIGDPTWRKQQTMSKLRELLEHFNGRLEDERKNNSKDITVDKEKLCDLLSEVEAMLAVAKSRLDPIRA